MFMPTQQNIILINEKGMSRSFRLNRPFSFLICLFVVLLLCFYALCAVFMVARTSTKVLLVLSDQKSTRIHKEFQNMETLTGSLTTKMESLFVTDDIRRVISGAMPIASDVREVGIGGLSTLEDYEKTFFSNYELRQKTLNGQIEKLLRQSDLQFSSLDDFDTFFHKKKDSLEQLPTIQPVEGVFLSGFGMRKHPIFKTRRMHNGVDIRNNIGTPVMASADGMAKTGVSPTFGNYVLLKHKNGFSTIYAHLHNVNVTGHHAVRRGEVIGYLGNSGRSTGPHLHYEVRLNRVPVDPLPYILPENFIVD